MWRIHPACLSISMFSRLLHCSPPHVFPAFTFAMFFAAPHTLTSVHTNHEARRRESGEAGVAMVAGMTNRHCSEYPRLNSPDDAHALSSAASTAFWLTGVACVSAEHLQPVCYSPRESKEEDGEVEVAVKQEEGQPAHAQGYCGNDSGSTHGLASSAFSSTATVAWLRRGEVRSAHKGGNGSNHSGVISQSSTVSKVPIHVLDETVMCNLVPLLPRTHAQMGLVSQVVPCTLWPPPVGDARATARVTSLQHAAGLAAELHYNALCGSTSPASCPCSFPVELPGALVEWSTGGVGYTADTEGLWAEQRVVRERHHHLPPLLIDCDACYRNAAAGDSADGDGVGCVGAVRPRMVQLRTPPSTLTGAVREQLRRFCRIQQERRLRNDNGEWVLCFARLVTITYELAAVLEQLTFRPGPASATVDAAAVDILPACDSLLDEMFLIGIVPVGEPHRLSLVCPSEAHRMLMEKQRVTPGSPSDGTDTTSGSTATVASAATVEGLEPRPSVAESLMELMTLALRESLCRRIGVQYELLRILRVKALAAAHRDLLLQYSRWFSSVPPPLAALHVLAGSTLFAPLVAQRWGRRATPPRAATGVKRRRPEDAEEWGEEDDAENDTNNREKEEEPEELRSTLPPRDRVGEAVATPPTRVPAEMDLLDDDYPARFAAWMRCNGGGGGGHSCHLNHHGSGSNHGGGMSGGCDEVALAATVSWLRRRRRTMTLKELDAFARKKR
ncbi:hypothetical protein TRSC58_04772 [Trypanosoma rangeli SC58]|uniref:Uncharacterized protein n=1 Tax=Trypanosoma rangeli SC58 TaxID=429131 RepID=A0A061J2M1_TRYRA|nr:hypothetical protein TRSC58_04772 [Trypanosoma rangeli SC58]